MKLDWRKIYILPRKTTIKRIYAPSNTKFSIQLTLALANPAGTEQFSSL